MSITRVSLAELLESPYEFSAEEKALIDGMTDEDLRRNALADPDTQPWTDDMFRRARADRHRRQLIQRSATERLGAVLTRAEPELDLPIWEVTDQNGRTMLLKAADIRRMTSDSGMETVVTIEALAPREQSSPKDHAEKHRKETPEPSE